MATGYAAYTTGVIARFTDNDNFVALMVGSPARPPTTSTQIRLMKVKAGSVTTLGSNSSFPTASSYEADLTIRASGGYRALVNGVEVFTGTDSDLATGGTLASGKVGIIDWYTSASAATRTIADFTVFVPAPEEAAIHSSQDLEFREDTAIRESSAGDYYSTPSGATVTNPPVAVPSGSEGITNRALIMASRFNPDLASHPLADQFTVEALLTPVYALAVSEA